MVLVCALVYAINVMMLCHDHNTEVLMNYAPALASLQWIVDVFNASFGNKLVLVILKIYLNKLSQDIVYPKSHFIGTIVLSTEAVSLRRKKNLNSAR